MRIEELHELVQKLKRPLAGESACLADDLLGQVKTLTERDEVRA